MSKSDKPTLEPASDSTPTTEPDKIPSGPASGPASNKPLNQQGESEKPFSFLDWLLNILGLNDKGTTVEAAASDAVPADSKPGQSVTTPLNEAEQSLDNSQSASQSTGDFRASGGGAIAAPEPSMWERLKSRVSQLFWNDKDTTNKDVNTAVEGAAERKPFQASGEGQYTPPEPSEKDKKWNDNRARAYEDTGVRGYEGYAAKADQKLDDQKKGGRPQGGEPVEGNKAGDLQGTQEGQSASKELEGIIKALGDAGVTAATPTDAARVPPPNVASKGGGVLGNGK